MDIIVLIGQRKEQYEGQYAPEVLLAMNALHYEEDGYLMDKKIESCENYMAALAKVRISIEDNELDHILNPTIPAIMTTTKSVEVVKLDENNQHHGHGRR